MRMIRIVNFILLAAGALLLAPVYADEATPMAEDPVLEARVLEVAKELRCLVCQNQTIADSSAELAIDLKNQVREMLVAGKSEQEIIDYMVQRYGDFVRYRPPVKSTTYLLWYGPFVLFVLGGGLLIYNLRRRRKLVDERPFSAEEHSRAEALLNRGSGENNE